MTVDLADLTPESLVRRYYELVDDGEHDALFELFTDDVVYDRPGQASIEGKEAFKRFYREGRPLEDGSHEVNAVVVSEDDAGAEGDSVDGADAADMGPTVAVRGTFSGVQDGEQVRFGFADFHTFDGDRIGRRYTYTDRDEV